MKIKILALVLARGKSRRLLKKNLKKIGNKTLVELAILSGQNIKEIVDILVSTDNKKIFKIAKKAGALVPWLRPKNLSKNTSTSAESAIHALDWYEKSVSSVDALLLLQPTSPFRKKKTIINAIRLFKKNRSKQIVSTFYTKKKIFLKKELINGVIYLTPVATLKKYKTFYHKKFIPFMMRSKKEATDINTIEDLKIARKFYNKKFLA